MGMHFGIQVTGDVSEVIPDLIELGLDVLYYPEPNVVGIEKLAQMVGGLCVFTCMDWKTTGPLGTVEDARRETKAIIENFASPEGG